MMAKTRTSVTKKSYLFMFIKPDPFPGLGIDRLLVMPFAIIIQKNPSTLSIDRVEGFFVLRLAGRAYKLPAPSS